MINFSKILTEGRYDSLTREISNDIMYVVKNSINTSEDEAIEAELPADVSDWDNYSHESGIDIKAVVTVHRMERLYHGKTYRDFYVNTFIDENNELVMDVFLDMDKEPQSYEKLFYKINEDVRHEIEHYTQQIMDSKPKSDVDTATLDTSYEHHTNPTEIPALVHGFYRRARLEKRPLDDIMWEDLNDDIASGNITQDEAEDLFRIWINYSRRRLPKAIYSNQ